MFILFEKSTSTVIIFVISLIARLEHTENGPVSWVIYLGDKHLAQFRLQQSSLKYRMKWAQISPTSV